LSEIRIRRARVAEADALVELWMTMMREHERLDGSISLSPEAAEHYREYLHYHLLDREALVLAALDGKEIIGFALAMKCQNLPMFLPAEYGYISDMIVLPRRRGHGIGGEMFARISEWFRTQGVKCIQLQVYDGNNSGHRFWNKVGFRDFISRCWMDL
jgi:GNAT superfamily N-acetyltransferase